jgi:hypothetical protein
MAGARQIAIRLQICATADSGNLRYTGNAFTPRFSALRGRVNNPATLRRISSNARAVWRDILQVGRNDSEGWFYYVMELADNSVPSGMEFRLQPAERSPVSTASKTPSPELAKAGTTYFPPIDLNPASGPAWHWLAWATLAADYDFSRAEPIFQKAIETMV